MQNGGQLVAKALHTHGVSSLFTLCGGHISPILVGCKEQGITVVDVRDEANALFAADATARLTGIPGVAAVTAGPGVTNTITALKNAQMAQSPVILLGGATATVLKGRGSLQDIDQLTLIKPLVKWAVSVRQVCKIPTILQRAFHIARSGIPGPVFIELPVDLLYGEETVRQWYIKEAGLESPKGVPAKALKLYLERHLNKQFAKTKKLKRALPIQIPAQSPLGHKIKKTVKYIKEAERPVLIIGSGALIDAKEADSLAAAVKKLGIPTFLGGMARGLLGHRPEIQFRHKRSAALRASDLVIVVGFPFDFRLGYGKSINARARVVAVNRDSADLRKNRRPTLGVQADGASFLNVLSREFSMEPTLIAPWFKLLRKRESQREEEIAQQAQVPADEFINPLLLCQKIEEQMNEDSVIVVDGGDFVATASYILKPRNPLSWLDPGVFGTLGVGGGFALGASLVRPEAETWLIYGDGSAGYTLMEFDTFVRHNIPVIAVVGTDASWAQIAREQIDVLEDDVGTVLRRTAYHTVAEGFGGKGILVEHPDQIDDAISQAKQYAAAGHPVLLNVQIGQTDFRKGSISI